MQVARAVTILVNFQLGNSLIWPTRLCLLVLVVLTIATQLSEELAMDVGGKPPVSGHFGQSVDLDKEVGIKASRPGRYVNKQLTRDRCQKSLALTFDEGSDEHSQVRHGDKPERLRCVSVCVGVCVYVFCVWCCRVPPSVAWLFALFAAVV